MPNKHQPIISADFDFSLLGMHIILLIITYKMFYSISIIIIKCFHYKTII